MNQCAQDLTAWSLAEARKKDLDAILHVVNEATHAAIEVPVSRLLRTGIGFRTRVLFIKDDGAEVPLEYYGRAIRTRESQIAGLMFVFCDVSQRRLMEQALRNNERLTITGRLAATVAHEIHNPLDAITNLLYLIAQGTQEAQTQDYVSLASQELERVVQITRQFLTFQRESVHPVPVRIEEIIDNVLALYARKISYAGITIEKKVLFDGSLLAHPGEMRQVVANLVGNSIDAVQHRHGRIQIRVYFSRQWRSGRTGLRLVIADNGPGIATGIQNKIFEAFFTTKGERGTGLGLWISREIIDKYEGTIRLRSSTRLDRSGTCFSVFLPT
jgi:signal transduction histidine kinase